MKFGIPLRNLFGIKCTEFYSDSFGFHISVVQCLGVYFFTGHSVYFSVLHPRRLQHLKNLHSLLHIPLNNQTAFTQSAKMSTINQEIDEQDTMLKHFFHNIGNY